MSQLRQALEVFIPAIVIGELYFGAAKSGRPAENADRIERFAIGRTILACDLDVAREYGRLKSYLKSKGRPIPENDIWIAAVARIHKLTLITRDSHFTAVDDLPIESWAVSI